MKRRGFLGGMVGAAVAGPGLAKQAMTGIGSSLAGRGAIVGSLLPSGANTLGYASQAVIDNGYHAKALAKIAGLTIADRAKLKRMVYVDRLDPDIDSYKSLSLSAKISMQKDRNLDTRLAERKSMLERIVSNIIPEEAEDFDWF